MALSPELQSKIIELLRQPIPQNPNMPIVGQSIPIPFFGNIETARVATISLNPSNLEFVTRNHGPLLSVGDKRFADRRVLGAADGDTLVDTQVAAAYDSLINYFSNRPYTRWFDMLDKYAGRLFGASYYDGTMVNLDIYPWATQDKWSELRATDKRAAMREYGLLKEILSAGIFDYIYINGKGVKEQLEEYFGRGLTINEVPVVGTKYPSTYERVLYIGTLPGGTKLIGASCYIQNSYETDDFLTELHDIMAQNL